MTATLKTTALSTAIALAAIFMAPQMAAAEEAGTSAQPQQVASANYKPMYVYQEPDSLETIEELEAQFVAPETDESAFQNMIASSDDDC